MRRRRSRRECLVGTTTRRGGIDRRASLPACTCAREHAGEERVHGLRCRRIQVACREKKKVHARRVTVQMCSARTPPLRPRRMPRTRRRRWIRQQRRPAPAQSRQTRRRPRAAQAQGCQKSRHPRTRGQSRQTRHRRRLAPRWVQARASPMLQSAGPAPPGDRGCTTGSRMARGRRRRPTPRAARRRRQRRSPASTELITARRGTATRPAEATSAATLARGPYVPRDVPQTDDAFRMCAGGRGGTSTSHGSCRSVASPRGGERL